MKYEEIMSAGVTVYGSHVCVHEHKDELAYLSVVGAESGVVAALAAVLEKKTISFYTDEGGQWPGRNHELHYAKVIRPLPVNLKHPKASDSWVHGWIVLKIMMDSIDLEHQEDWWPDEKTCRFGMLVKKDVSRKRLSQEFFNRLRQFLRKTPVHTSWAEWLWNYVQSREGWIQKYVGMVGDKEAYICRIVEGELQEAIQAGIRQRVPELVNVFGDEGQEPVVIVKEEEKPMAQNSILQTLMGNSQRQAVLSGCRGEEGEFFTAKIAELQQTFETMPKTYETDGQGDEAIVYFHYFSSSSDWWITERDQEDEQLQAFGLACLNGDWQMAETGYICLPELLEHGVELDLYWTPKTIGEIKENEL